MQSSDKVLLRITTCVKEAARPVRWGKKKARNRWLNVSTTCLITVPKVTIRVMEMGPQNDLANKPTGHKLIDLLPPVLRRFFPR